jgi:hypothetical protein
MKKLFWLTLLAAALGCASPAPLKTAANAASSPQPQDSTQYAWVEMVPTQLSSSQLMARVITHSAQCPDLMVTTVAGGTGARHATLQMKLPMKVRAISSPSFNVLSCEVALPANARHVLLDGKNLPILPLAAFQMKSTRIAVLGDTGCRLKGANIQACNNPHAWPLKKIIAAIAAWKPTLIIHVGDYFYRESACPEAEPGCAGSPHGENWEAWRQDFFEPASAAFQDAPWIMIRGNHEDCARGGDGWDRFLEVHPYSMSCNQQVAPYQLEVAGHDFWVLDSAMVENITTSLAEIRHKKPTGEPVWLMTHRPFTVGRDQLPAHLQLILNGHFHDFRILPPQNGMPPEIITGNGGTKLDEPPAGITANDARVHAVSGTMASWNFGFLGLERVDAGSWKISEHDQDGKEIYTCLMKEHKTETATLSCQ